jgi:hypothetical protein
MTDTLSLDDFFDLLGRYGSDVNNWPLSSGQMQAVVSFLARSTTARDALEEMRVIEAEMRLSLPRAPVGLADRILAAAGVPGRQSTPIYAHPRQRPTHLN